MRPLRALAAVALGVTLGATVVRAEAEWQTLAPGLAERTDDHDGAVTVALRVDPAEWALRVVTAKGLGLESATATQFGEKTGAAIAVNGGFFDRELVPVGLRMSGGSRIAGAYNPRLGTLLVRDGRFDIVFGAARETVVTASEVVQCRPRLVVDGAANRLKRQVARRTVAGIDAAGRLVLVVTSVGMLGANEIAVWLAAPESDGGMGLVSALNLDGGSSTQLYARVGERVIDVPGRTPVADALVVVPRSR